jgi:hypothetical protein
MNTHSVLLAAMISVKKAAVLGAGTWERKSLRISPTRYPDSAARYRSA